VSASTIRTRLALAVLGAASLLPAQESAPDVDRIADRANHQNPYFSAQGLKALKAQGAAALPAVERFVARRSVHALAPLVVEWLGEVPEDGARKILRAALGNPEFPWRPQAARALGKSPREAEADLFLAASKDALPAVREAALLALGQLAAKDASLRPRALAGLEAGMEDPQFEPRLAAAEALLAAGEKRALPVLLEALSVERRFFDVDFGVLARRRAWAALQPLAGAGVAYDPSAGPAKNADALREIARRVASLVPPRPETGPSKAPLAKDVDDVVFGVEVRSCRAGDQWIRLTGNGELVLGHYDLERRKVPEPELRELRRLLGETARPASPESRLDPGAYFGRPGCDFEKWYVPDEPSLLRLTVGQEGRPGALEALHRALGGAVEATFGPGAAEGFKERTSPFAKPDAGED
jgi:HEAT repeat protein